MGFIVQRLNDYRIQLSREEIVRPMSFGANWQTLRISGLSTICGGTNDMPNSYAATGFSPLSVGVTQGSFGINNENTVDAIYASPGSTPATTTWLYSVGPNATYTPNSGGINVNQKIGGTITSLGTSSSQNVVFAADTLNQLAIYRMGFVFDILKNNLSTTLTTYTFNFYAPTSVQQADMAEDLWFDRIQTFSAPTGMTLSASVTTAAVTGAMNHDNVFIFWSRFCPVLELCAWAVIRFG